VSYAVATFLAFPHPVGGRVLDLGLVFAWLAPACLLLALRGLPPGRAARLGFLAGLLAHSAVLHWIYVVTVRYGHAPALVGLVAPVALAAYIALFPGLFGLVYAWWVRAGLGSPFAAAVLWTALDHARSFVLTGFPWATLGYAQHDNVPLLGLAAWTGVYGLSFASVLAGAGLAECLARRRVTRASLAAFGVVLVLHAVAPLLAPDRLTGPSLRVAVLQGNIDQGVKWSADWLDQTLEIYETLSRQAGERGAQLVVWPETALPGSPSLNAELGERLERLAQETGAALVVGAVGVEGEPPAWRVYDSAFVISPDGVLTDRYDKAHLVPFGEYVPLRGLLGWFLSSVASGIASGDVQSGTGPRPMLVAPAGGGAPVSVGVPICYELLFPDLVRRFVGGGGRLLLAITNDAWYGRTGAPYQFLAITALRSAETGAWTARAANTGVSGFIDERGRVRQASQIFERGLLVEDVPLRAPSAPDTFYVRHGDVFAAACWLAASLLASVAWWRSRGPS